MSAHNAFEYQAAFSRTLGWITESEQMQLRHKRIAIAGAGGVGGVHLLTLVRLGIGAFNIADMDVFELPNFNRQAGAMTSTLGTPKTRVMSAMALDINPGLDLREFPLGIDAGNVEAFLQDVDLYVDALDFFAFEARSAVFAACARLGIPAITVAPLGMGAALMNFLPGRMTFEQYFGFSGASEEEKSLRFLVGLAPNAGHGRYLVDPTRMRPSGPDRGGPSTPMAVQLCAGIAGTEALKVLLRRGRVLCAPHAITYDAFLNRQSHTWRPWGHRNPLTRLRVALVRHIMARHLTAGPSRLGNETPTGPMQQVLDLARWAPSGDNEQPWTFQPLSDRTLRVHFTGRKPDDLYDYDGRPSRLSFGCLVESLQLAASRVGWRMEWQYQPHPGPGGTLDIRFEERSSPADPLSDFLALRSVDRRPYRLESLPARQKTLLEAAAGTGHSIVWLESLPERWALSRLNSLCTLIRLGLPEAIRTHRRILDWENTLSPDKVPATAVGIHPWMLPMMRWVMADPARAEFILGHLPGSTLPTRWELDLLPGIRCGAHFMLVRNASTAASPDVMDIEAGQAVQRFWLTATRLGLALQPSVATLAFAHYARHDMPFSSASHAPGLARKLSSRFTGLCVAHDIHPDAVAFMGRIGTPQPKPLASRSTRKPLDELLDRSHGHGETK